MSIASTTLELNAANTVKASKPPKPYLLPFKVAVEALGLEGDIPKNIKVTQEQLNEFMTILLRGVAFDEAWYLARYPDVEKAIALGECASARQHFIEDGYREGRQPAPVVVDEAWYAETYPDIAESVEVGEFQSCQDHFDQFGREEGRLPGAL